MKKNLLKNRRWQMVMVLLCCFAIGSWADEATNLKMLGNYGTVVSGQDYRLFTFSNGSGQAKWYYNKGILILDNVSITNTGTESFIQYLGTSQINVQLIGDNHFRYDKSKKANPVINSNGYLVIESKDVKNRGALTITTYGHITTSSAAIVMSGYSSSRATMNVRHCTLNVYRQGTGWGSSVNYNYNVFTSTGSNKGVLRVQDATMNLQSFGNPILGNATMTLTDKDCIYNADVKLSNGALVADDGSGVYDVEIGYPLLFGTYDYNTDKYVMNRTGTYSTKEDYGTDSVVVYDEETHVLTMNGGTATGSFIYYGHDDLVVNVKGDKQTAITCSYGNGIETKNGSLTIRGDHVPNYKGLKMISNSSDAGIKVPSGKTLFFEHNAKVELTDFSIGIEGYEPEGGYSSPNNYVETPSDLSNLKINNSSLKISHADIVLFGFGELELKGCESDESYTIKGYMKDESYYDEEGNPYDYLYVFYANTLYDSNGEVAKEFEFNRTANFGLIVGGRELTLDNIYDIDFKTTKSEVRGVTYDDDNNTLTLDNAYIWTTGSGQNGTGIQYYGTTDNLTIQVKGESYIHSEAYVGIYSLGMSVNIYGNYDEQKSPLLRIDSKWEGISLMNCAHLLVSACDLDVHSATRPAFCGFYNPGGGVTTPQKATLLMSASNAKFSSASGPSTQYVNEIGLEGPEILYPNNAYFDADLGGVALNNELVTGDVIIGTNIVFQDANVKNICVANWDTNNDEGINLFEAQAVSKLNGKFTEKTSIQYFNELVYFTGLTQIDENAFYNCTGLKEVTIPHSVVNLNANCFSKTALESIVIPKNVQSMNGCFASCAQLESVEFEEGSVIESLGTKEFYECESLGAINIPAGISKIPDYAFYYCTNLWDVTFADGTLKEIGDYAFAYSGFYANVPNGVERIGDYAFYGTLTEMTSLPASVKYVGKYAMSGFMGVDIPENSQLVEVGDYAFAYCSSYNSSLTLPVTLKKIGEGAFSNGHDECYMEIDVKRNSPATIGTGIFGKLSDISVIYVPSGRVNAYKTAWPEYAAFIVGKDPTIATSISSPVVELKRGDVYNMRGQLIRKNATTEGLPSGIYIVNGKKIIVK